MSEYPSKMKVLVTGADGMLGNNIVRELIDRNAEVSCFIENHKDGATLQGLPVKIYKGDLNCIEDLEPIFKKCDYVINTAGITALWPARSDLSWKVNYRAVKLLVKLSKKYGVKRFIQIGTATSFGHGPIDNPGTEESAYTNSKFKLDYQDTKYAAQEYLIQEFRENNFPVIVLNPTFMIGKYDNGRGSNKMVLMLYKGKMPGYTLGGKNYVNVKDVASLSANALVKGRLGECYIAANRNMTYEDAFSFIAKTLEVKPPKLKLPKFLGMILGAFMSVIAAITGKVPDLSYRMTMIGFEGCYYSPQKAINELDMPQSSIEDGVRDSLAWFKEIGMLE